MFWVGIVSTLVTEKSEGQLVYRSQSDNPCRGPATGFGFVSQNQVFSRPPSRTTFLSGRATTDGGGEA